MSDVVEVIEDVVNVSIDETHIEVVSVGTQGPPGPTGDPATNLVTSVVGETGDVTLEMMGLDLVDNTPDVDKPVSTLQQAALSGKLDKTGGTTTGPITTPTIIGGAVGGIGNFPLVSGNLALGAVIGAAGYIQTFGNQPLRLNDVSNAVYINKLGYLTGTGFPNGVMSAPVGSIYIDAAVTSGASLWVKKSGTGNTGWQVIEGDTGWRDLGQLWSSISNRIWIRRIGSVCYITSNGDAMATVSTVVNSAYFTTSGFAPTGRSEILIADNGTIRGRILAKQTEAALFLTINTLSLVNAFVNNSYLTASAWPTTLPGTAV